MVFSAAPGERTGVVLSTVDNSVVIVEGYAVNTGATGAVAGSIPISTPMRITSALCVRQGLNQEAFSSRVRIRGFLAPND